MKLYLLLALFLVSLSFFEQQIGLQKTRNFTYDINDDTLITIKEN